jgi:hypothetical protein
LVHVTVRGWAGNGGAPLVTIDMQSQGNIGGPNPAAAPSRGEVDAIGTLRLWRTELFGETAATVEVVPRDFYWIDYRHATIPGDDIYALNGQWVTVSGYLVYIENSSGGLDKALLATEFTIPVPTQNQQQPQAASARKSRRESSRLRPVAR